jgi:phosphatidylinositol 4-kinase A
MSKALNVNHPLYDVYLVHLLSSIISKGDVPELEHHRPHTEISVTANDIARYLTPLAELLPQSPHPSYDTDDAEIDSLFRNAWFNMVVHGFSKNSQIALKYMNELEIIARSTPPLVSETSLNKIESELELNTVLQRGSSHSNVNNQREIMASIFSLTSFEFRSIQYPKLMFLSATVLLESLRSNTGNCSKVLLYFGDPGFRSGDTGKYMANIATDVMKSYITNVIRGGKEEFTIGKIAEQLKETLILCCHRVKAVRNIAFTCSDLLIHAIPSALCRQASVFTLLELISLLWTSCLDAETDEYEPRTVFQAKRTGIRLELSDSYDYRRESLEKLLNHARKWVKFVLSKMTFEMKSLLTGYLSGIDEYRSMSHASLGTTFALEMGGTITRGDGELASVAGTRNIMTDSLSGFLSQYMWRSEFTGEGKKRLASDIHDKGVQFQVRDELEKALQDTSQLSFDYIRTLLFEACELLTGDWESNYIARMIVIIPFKLFTEKSIQLGISLWLWALNEKSPTLKTTILAQVGQEFEKSAINRLGLYSRKHDLIGPEYSKMEYAPSNKAELDHESKVALRSYSVHLHLIRFLSSVFQASIHESKNLLKIFTNCLRVGLEGCIKLASLHPLARSVRFELIKYGLDVLSVHARFSAKICDPLKNLIIDAALSWFKQPAHWPFGGNKLKLRSDLLLFQEIAQ